MSDKPGTDIIYSIKNAKTKPPRVRLKKVSEELRINVPQALPRKQSSPPWEKFPNIINTELADLQRNTTVQQTYQDLFAAVMENNLINNNRRIELVWIPSHQGINGNEEADQLAKEATNKDTIDELPIVMIQDTKKLVKKIILTYWNDWWIKECKTDLGEIRESIMEPNPVDAFPR
ncbi:hypothetical protein KQX54_014136 [Cotesia glomerata]|uniref:RNase H type-1 domain-containing protein n=1 Tax=Cotesia glomerata TaxID=32391 RepID=A0AAV7I5X0_COTGL|nr:hypothetical protein KQX54_014136 [Cotesia glomerata]